MTIRDVIAVTGLVMLTAGTFACYPPASAVVLGSLLLIAGLTSHFLTRTPK